MKLKRRHKSSRFRGTKTHRRGFKKKARGSGHQGGVGMAGTGKRGDQKKTLVLNLFGNDYFGKDKTLRRGNVPAKLKSINLQYIQDNFYSLTNSGKAKEEKGMYTLDFKGYKILGEGSISHKVTIKASGASASAMEKIKKAGGMIEIVKSAAAKKQK